MIDKEFIKQLLQDLPGETAHLDFFPLRETTSSAIASGAQFRLAAVAIILYIDNNNKLNTIVIERQDYDGKHSGQISFPGGKFENEDHTTIQTAIRECYEEIGICIDEEHYIGDLSDVYIPISQFLIKAHVFYCENNTFNFVPSIREVKRIIPIDLSLMFQPENKVEVDIQLEGGHTMKNVPHFVHEEVYIWGATGLILNELKHLLKSI